MTPFQAADILGQFRSRLDEAVLAGIKTATEVARGYAVQDLMARGRHSNVMSDPGRKRLWQTVRSIEPRAETSGQAWSGGLAAGDADVPYARIQEFGGTTRPHVIVPRNAKVLAFEWPKKGPGTFFFARVNHPGSRIPPLHYLRNAIERIRQDRVAQQAIKREVLKRCLPEFTSGVA